MFFLMFEILNKHRYSYDNEDFRVLSHNVLPNAMWESTGPSSVGSSMMRRVLVHNESDDEDSDKDDNVM